MSRWKPEPVIVRLAAKIGIPELNVPELGMCWPFAGARTGKGYGIIRDDDGKVRYAHRIALAAALGRPLRPGMLACHRCDEKACVRPRHLYEGTRSDNELDKWYVMREPKGDVIRFPHVLGRDEEVA